MNESYLLVLLIISGVWMAADGCALSRWKPPSRRTHREDSQHLGGRLVGEPPLGKTAAYPQGVVWMLQGCSLYWLYLIIYWKNKLVDDSDLIIYCSFILSMNSLQWICGQPGCCWAMRSTQSLPCIAQPLLGQVSVKVHLHGLLVPTLLRRQSRVERCPLFGYRQTTCQ